MNTEYKHDRYICPFCGSDNTDPDANDATDDYGYQFDSECVYHHRYCCECGTSYKITYRAASVTKIND